MIFRVGQKVVCVDDSDTDQYLIPSMRGHAWGDLSGLTKGSVYTVRGIGGDHASIVPTIYLAEIVREPDFSYGVALGECGFAACRFRPIVDRKTDISVFTEALDGARPRVPA